MYGRSLPKVLDNSIQKELLNEYVKNRDPDIKEKLVLHNLRLVKAISLRYKENGNSLKDQEDLFHEGVIGLMSSLESYDPDKGEFANYAASYIKASIRAYIRDKAQPLRVPAGVYELLYKVDAFKEQYENKYYKQPTMKQISAALDISLSRLKAVLDIDRRVISLDSYLPGDSEIRLGETVVDPDSDFTEGVYSSISFNEMITECKKHLSSDELEVLNMYYGLTCRRYKITEMTKILNITYQKAVSMKNDSLRRIRRTGYMAKIKREINEETVWYKSPRYSDVFIKSSQTQSPVENIVMQREKKLEEIMRRYDSKE